MPLRMDVVEMGVNPRTDLLETADLEVVHLHLGVGGRLLNWGQLG